jgi:hypothetical protein
VISDTIRDDSTGGNEEASGGHDKGPSERTGDGNPDLSNTAASAGMIPRISVNRDLYVICGRLDRPDAAWAHKACRDMPRSPSNSLAGSNAAYAVLTLKGRLWGGGGPDKTVLKYFFVDGNDVQHEKVKTVIATWELYAFVSFQEQESAEKAHIRITFDGNDGSWSYVRIQIVSNTIF